MGINYTRTEIIAELDGIDIKLLEEIDYLSRLQAKNGSSGARYCFPSEKYLASKLSCARETISRHISKLARLGVLEVIHRRKVGGHWQTNLYKIVDWAWSKLGRILRRIGQTPPKKAKKKAAPEIEPENKVPGKIMAALEEIKAKMNRVTPPSHKAYPIREKESQKGSKGARSELKSILEQWNERGEKVEDELSAA